MQLLFTLHKTTWFVRNTSVEGLWEHVLIIKAQFQCAWVNNLIQLHLCSFLSHKIKLRGLLEILVKGLWEYMLIVKA